VAIGLKLLSGGFRFFERAKTQPLARLGVASPLFAHSIIAVGAGVDVDLGAVVHPADMNPHSPSKSLISLS
jgi:hypothetical protein